MTRPSDLPRPALPRGAVWALLVLLLAWSLAVRLFFGLRPAWNFDDHDERYNRRNVRQVVVAGEWRPENSYYSFLSYGPQAAIAAGLQRLSEATGEKRLALFGPDVPVRRGIYFYRAIQALYGAALVLVVFRLARELGGDVAGLLAAAAVSTTPFFVWAGAWFKPDALAALTFSLAMLWAVRALERPSRRKLLLAGVGVGLAASAKLTGVLAALPLLLGAPVVARRSLRRWGELALAAAASAAVFLATFPYLHLHLHYLRGIEKHYALRAAEGGHSYGEALRSLYGGHFLPTLHGPLVTALFWLGVVALAIPAANRHVERERLLSLRVVAATTLLFPVAALALAGAPFLRSNNLFPALPLVAVIACVAGVELWRRTAARRGRFDRPAVAWAAALLVVLVPVVRDSREIHARSLPTTADTARQLLSVRLTSDGSGAGPRIVVQERLPADAVAWRGSYRFGDPDLAIVSIDEFERADGDRLARADAEVFPERRLHGRSRDFYAARVAATRAQGAVELVAPRWLRVRGPTLVVLLHPWTAQESRRLGLSPAGEGSWHLRFPPELVPGELVSLVVRPRTPRGMPAALVHAGRELPLHRTASRGVDRRFTYTSERFSPRPEESVWLGGTIESPGARGAAPDALLDLWRWRSAARPFHQPGPQAVARPRPDELAEEQTAGAMPPAP